VNFSIVPVFQGNKAKIYTIKFLDSELTEWEEFVYENMNKVPVAVRKLNKQLELISNKNGIIDDFFTRESEPNYNVFRLSGTKEKLRLYCIKYSNVAVILGGGGIKGANSVKLQENPHLNKICEELKRIEILINQKLSDKEIRIDDEGFHGNLNFSLDED
jgi:hypothetical protein